MSGGSPINNESEGYCATEAMYRSEDGERVHSPLRRPYVPATTKERGRSESRGRVQERPSWYDILEKSSETNCSDAVRQLLETNDHLQKKIEEHSIMDRLIKAHEWKMGLVEKKIRREEPSFSNSSRGRSRLRSGKKPPRERSKYEGRRGCGQMSDIRPRNSQSGSHKLEQSDGHGGRPHEHVNGAERDGEQGVVATGEGGDQSPSAERYDAALKFSGLLG